MSDLTALLASLIHKEAIKEGKLDFLSKRYAPKLKEYIIANDVLALKNEDDPVAGEQNKKDNATALNAQYKTIIESVAKADPTDAQNKNDYTEWLLKQWLTLDNPHKARWNEDAETISANLTEFSELRNSPEFKAGGNSTDINQYADLAALKAVVTKYSHSDARYTLPELSDATVVVYKDRNYILWQVNSAEDLVKLSSFPPNNQPAWCTKDLSTARTYVKTGPEYIAYKDGDPLFQIDPHDASGKPQFMSRHNTRMHSSKMMNSEAAEILNRVMSAGNLNPQAEKDLAYVLSIYKSPNLNDADTFEYLKEYVLVNGSAAKKDPRFLEIEQSYVKPRYLMMEPDELRQMTNRYGRTGEATKDYLTENKFVARLVAKLDALPSFTAFRALCPKGATHNTIDRIDAVEEGLCYRLDGLFKHVFALFDKEFGFSEKFKQFKEAIKAQDALKTGALGIELVSLLKDNFPEGYGARFDNFTYTYMTEHYGERKEHYEPRTSVAGYIKVIEQQVQPYLKQGFEERVRMIDQGIEDAAEAADQIKSAFQSATAAVSEGGKSGLDYKTLNEALNRVAGGKLDIQLAGMTKIKEISEFLTEMFKSEMESHRGWPRRVVWSESKLPDWAKVVFDKKRNELEALKEQAREQKLKEQEGKEKSTRWSPKQEFERWSRNHGPDTPDPEERTVKFILNSPSYHNSTKAEFLIDMKKTYDFGDDFITTNARNNVGDYEIFRYMKRHHNKRWPELEATYPRIVWSEEYQDIAFKGQRIPAIEESELRDVAPNDDLSSQMDYMRKHLKGKRWPELEKRVAEVFNAADWRSERYSIRPDRLANAILKYIKEFMGSKRWPEIEDKMFEDEDEGLKYVFEVLPDARQRMRKLMEQHHADQLAGGTEEKKSSLHTTILARLKKELEQS